MPEEADEVYLGLARREAAQRVDRMVAALRENPDAWDNVYREAHTLSGIARDVDGRLEELARDVASRLRDVRGQRVALTPEAREELRRRVLQMSERVAPLRDGVQT